MNNADGAAVEGKILTLKVLVILRSKIALVSTTASSRAVSHSGYGTIIQYWVLTTLMGLWIFLWYLHKYIFFGTAILCSFLVAIRTCFLPKMLVSLKLHIFFVLQLWNENNFYQTSSRGLNISVSNCILRKCLNINIVFCCSWHGRTEERLIQLQVWSP